MFATRVALCKAGPMHDSMMRMFACTFQLSPSAGLTSSYPEPETVPSSSDELNPLCFCLHQAVPNGYVHGPENIFSGKVYVRHGKAQSAAMSERRVAVPPTM